jgi:hypothetical protein
MIILDVGLMNQNVDDESHRVHEQMPLATFDLFAAVIAAQPLFGLVFTD